MYVDVFVNSLCKSAIALYLIASGFGSAHVFAASDEEHAEAAQPGTLRLAERLLPVPSATSQALKTAIENMPAPNINAVKRITPDNTKIWDAFVNSYNARREKSVEELKSRFKVSVSRDKFAGVAVHQVLPPQVDAKHKNHLFLHIHGGAYLLGEGTAGLVEAVIIAGLLEIPVISIDYRMPPDHPFPAAVEDVARVYQHLLKNRSADSIVMGGSSAGGGLTLASTHKFIELGLDLPAALWAGTPWSDLSKTGDSLYINEGIDPRVVTYDGFAASAARLYAGSTSLKHPLVSPVYGDFKGFPPTFLVSGTRDLNLSHTVRAHRAIRTSGSVADLNVYEGMAHGDYLHLVDAPESREIFRELDAFWMKYLK